MVDIYSDFLNDILKKDTRKIEVLSKKVLTNYTKNKLLSYQEPHAVRLINILSKKDGLKIAIDASDTGIGKTYIAAGVCKDLKKRPIIICPKILIYNWLCVLDFFNIECYDVVNYETIKNGKTYSNAKFTTRKKSKFIKIVDDNKEPYQWDLPDDAILIFDEAHRCKNPSTNNGKLLLSVQQLAEKNIPVILLSATICERPHDIKIPFRLLGFIDDTRQFNQYFKSLRNKYPQYKVKKSDYPNHSARRIARENAQAMIIYQEIKEYTSRIKIKDLGDKFPKNQICCQQFFAEESDEIAKAYQKMAEHMVKLKENPGENHLAKIIKLKQEIELRKIPLFIEQSKLYLEEGKSVIIFVNYLKSLELLSSELNIECKIHGRQTLDERQEAIDLFQSNQKKIIICQIRAGGVGISLHDLHGGHQRVTLINYPDSAADLLQALGRAARANAKTPVLQRILFVANVEFEKKIMKNINKKLANISAVNDGDLDGHKYYVKKITRERKAKKID